MSSLRWAAKELGNEITAGPAAGLCSLVALSNLLLLEVFLYGRQPQAATAVGQAMFKAGAHSVALQYMSNALSPCIISFQIQVNRHCMHVCFACSECLLSSLMLSHRT